MLGGVTRASSSHFPFTTTQCERASKTMYSPWVAFCAGRFFLRAFGGLRRSFTARRSHEINRHRLGTAVCSGLQAALRTSELPLPVGSAGSFSTWWSNPPREACRSRRIDLARARRIISGPERRAKRVRTTLEVSGIAFAWACAGCRWGRLALSDRSFMSAALCRCRRAETSSTVCVGLLAGAAQKWWFADYATF